VIVEMRAEMIPKARFSRKSLRQYLMPRREAPECCRERGAVPMRCPRQCQELEWHRKVPEATVRGAARGDSELRQRRWPEWQSRRVTAGPQVIAMANQQGAEQAARDP